MNNIFLFIISLVVSADIMAKPYDLRNCLSLVSWVDNDTLTCNGKITNDREDSNNCDATLKVTGKLTTYLVYGTAKSVTIRDVISRWESKKHFVPARGACRVEVNDVAAIN